MKEKLYLMKQETRVLIITVPARLLSLPLSGATVGIVVVCDVLSLWQSRPALEGLLVRRLLLVSLFECLGKGADDDLLEPALHVVFVAVVLIERAV